MRKNRRCLDDFTGAVHDGHLDAGPQTATEADGGTRTRGRGQQQVMQIPREYPDRLFLGTLTQRREQLALELPAEFYLPGPARRLQEPRVRGALLVRNLEVGGDAALAAVEGCDRGWRSACRQFHQ